MTITKLLVISSCIAHYNQLPVVSRSSSLTLLREQVDSNFHGCHFHILWSASDGPASASCCCCCCCCGAASFMMSLSTSVQVTSPTGRSVSSTTYTLWMRWLTIFSKISVSGACANHPDHVCQTTAPAKAIHNRHATVSTQCRPLALQQ